MLFVFEPAYVSLAQNYSMLNRSVAGAELQLGKSLAQPEPILSQASLAGAELGVAEANFCASSAPVQMRMMVERE